MTEFMHSLDAQGFPYVTYRRGAAGRPIAVMRGTGIRIQTLVTAYRSWGMTPAQVAEEYELTVEQVENSLEFYRAHRSEVEAVMAEESLIEQARAREEPRKA